MNTKSLMIVMVMGAVIYFLFKQSKQANSGLPATKKAVNSGSTLTDQDLINAITGETTLTKALTPDEVKRSVDLMKDAGFTDTEVFMNIPVAQPSVETQKEIAVERTLNEILRDMGQSGVWIPDTY